MPRPPARYTEPPVTLLLAGCLPPFVAKCHTLCAAEGWRPLAVDTLSQLWASVGYDAPWVVLLPTTLEGVASRDICGHLRFRTQAQDAALVGVVERCNLSSAHTDTIGFDTWVAHDAVAETIRAQLVSLLPIVAARRRRRSIDAL